MVTGSGVGSWACALWETKLAVMEIKAVISAVWNFINILSLEGAVKEKSTDKDLALWCCWEIYV